MTSKAARTSCDMDRERYISAAIAKEDKLRLRWFMANEENLDAAVHAPLQCKVPERAVEELQKSRRLYHVNKEKFGRHEIGEPDPPLIDPEALKRIMRPVDGATLRLLYTGERDGRKSYLRERIQLAPEKRYYCPETSSFLYGWNMWDHAKTRTNHGFGRSQIIKGSFYRRRGIGADPDWYTELAKLSPSTCQ